jgi:hypothetical protein
MSTATQMRTATELHVEFHSTAVVVPCKEMQLEKKYKLGFARNVSDETHTKQTEAS